MHLWDLVKGIIDATDLHGYSDTNILMIIKVVVTAWNQVTEAEE